MKKMADLRDKFPSNLQSLRNTEESSDEGQRGNEVTGGEVEEFHVQEDENTKSKKHDTKRGLAFLKRKWTIPEVLTTCGLFFEVFGFGLFHGILGPTLLDIEQLTGTTTAEVALMFTAMTVGALVGAPVGGYFLDKFNCRLVLAFELFGLGVMTAVVPLANNFVELMAISAILGVFCGATDCGQNVTALLIWGWDGAILMQAFHCVFALGTFAAPWLAAPFISADISTENTTTVVDQLQTEVSTATVTLTVQTAINKTLVDDEATGSKRAESRVHFTYLIVGAYSIIAAGLFVVAYMSHRKYYKNHPKIQRNKNKGITSEKNSGSKEREPKWFMLPVLILMFMRFAFYVGLDIMSASLLMTFAVKGLGWTKPQGIAVTSCFRGVYSAGRFASVVLAFLISPTKMIFLDLFLMLTGLLVLTIFIGFHDLVLWIFISLAGFGMGSFFGASMSWADKYLNVSGKTGSVFITGSWFGLLALPALTGYLFDNVSPFCYIYACFGDTVALTVVTLAVMALSVYYHKNRP